MKVQAMSTLNPDKMASYAIDVFRDPNNHFFAEVRRGDGSGFGACFWTSTYTSSQEAIDEAARRINSRDI